MAHFLLDDDKPIKNGETHKPPKNGGLVDFQGKTMVCKRYFLSKHAYLSMRKQLQFRDVLYYTHQKPWKTKKNTTSGGSNESPYDIFPLQPSSTSSTVPAPPPRGLVHHRLGIRQHLCPGVLEVLIRELGIHASARLGRIERAAKAGERCVQWLPGFSGGVGGCGVGLGSVFEIIYIYTVYHIYRKFSSPTKSRTSPNKDLWRLTMFGSVKNHPKHRVHFWRWKINWISSDLSKDPCYLP